MSPAPAPTLAVHRLEPCREGRWRFDGSELTWRHERHGSQVTFDPFPGYPHDVAVATETARQVQQICPPLWEIDLFLADREEIGRTNGHSNIHERGHYEKGEWVKDTPTGIILLSGKRIPPHPAMTRYLVAHEYGHHMEWMIGHVRGMKSYWNDDVLRDYAKARQLPEERIHHGEGGNWHLALAEVFANDFRILVAGIELEFWPHDGVDYPGDSPQRDWWAQALTDVELWRAKHQDGEPA